MQRIKFSGDKRKSGLGDNDMKNVSNDFRKVIRAGGPFYAYAKVVFSNGEELELTSQNDFYIDGNNYTESGGDGFPLGAAVSKTIDIGIDNSDERFSDYDFYYARITMYTEADLPSGKIERIKEGTFTVINSVAPGDVIEITASDDMYKADVEYVSKLSYPASALRVLQEACSQSNVNLGSVTFTNQDFQILGAPEGITCRQIFGYIAQIAGGNAVMDENNRLIIKTYNLPELDFIDIISGGFIGDSLNNKISGGIFGDNLKDYITAGKFGSNSNYAILSEFSTEPEIATDDVVITAIETTGEKDDEEVTYLYGKEGYVLAIENPLIKGAEEAAIKLIGDIVIGFRLRPFSGEFYPNPTLQFMDAVYLVDRKYNIYQTFITNHTFNYLGNSEFSNDTESPERNNSEYYSSATAAYRKAREELKRQKTEWEKAMEELKDRIDNSSGLYMTVKKQPDGSSIYYMHDKPTLKESMIVWKMTAEAFAVSSDGGKTYNAGLTVDGTLITKIMNTIGINFDWGVGGTLIIRTPSGTETLYADAKTGTVRISADTLKIGGKTVQNIADESTNKLDEKLGSTQEIFNRLTQNGKLQGLYIKNGQLYVNATYILSGTLTLGGSNNGNGILKIVDSDGNQTGYIDNAGVHFNKGTFSGDLLAAGGSFSGSLISSEITGGTIEGTAVIAKTLKVGKNFYVNNVGQLEAYAPVFYSDIKLTPTVDLGSGTPISAISIPSEKTMNVGTSSLQSINLMKTAFVYGSLLVIGGEKSRVVRTKHYADVKLNAVESPEAHFEDFGSGTIGNNGTITIIFETIFSETIDIDCDYQVFVTPTSSKTVNWVEKFSGYFVVHGEIGATFDWQLVCKQRDYEGIRLEQENVEQENKIEFDDSIFENDNLAIKQLQKYMNEYEKEIDLL